MNFKKRITERGKGQGSPRMKAGAFFAALFLALLLAAPAQAATLRDQSGSMVLLPDKPKRIVSLAPNITELLFALGGGKAVAGCCRHSDYPPETRSLPRVGSYYRPDLERIVALRPDLCLAVRDGVPATILERLEQLGIPVFTLDPQSLEALREALLLLGTILDQREAAEKLAKGMDERLARVDAVVAAHIRRRAHRPVVLVRVQASPFMAAARGAYPAQLLERAGGRAFPQGSVLYPRLSPEDLLALRPDLIIAPGDGPLLPESLPGGRSAIPVHGVPEDLLFRPSLRSLDALDRLVPLLWPREVQEAP